LSTHHDRRAEEHELQRQLRDLISLAVVGDHVRWVTDDVELADWLATAIAEWRAWADRVARQLSASGFAPDGRVRSLAKDISLNWVPEGWLSADQARGLLAGRLAMVARSARFRHSQADDANAQVLAFVATRLEAQMRSLRDLATAPRGNQIDTGGVDPNDSGSQAERSRAKVDGVTAR